VRPTAAAPESAHAARLRSAPIRKSKGTPVKTLQIATLVDVFASQTLLASAAAATPTVRDEQQMTQMGSQLLQDADHADKALPKKTTIAQ
jgi:hypothetical protein